MKIQHLAKSIAASLVLVLAFSAHAGMKVQNAQYNAKSGNLSVKGKVTDNVARAVYVYDARSNRYIGAIPTYARANQFNGDLLISSEERVPCSIRVQSTRNTSSGRRSLGRGGFFGEFDIVEVNRAPDHCQR